MSRSCSRKSFNIIFTAFFTNRLEAEKCSMVFVTVRFFETPLRVMKDVHDAINGIVLVETTMRKNN